MLQNHVWHGTRQNCINSWLLHRAG